MKTTHHAASVFSAIAACMLAGALSGCANSHKHSSVSSATTTQAQQQAMTPDQALARLTEGNRRFVAGTSLHRDLPAQRASTASGQFPFAVVHSCIDSRTSPEIIFDQGIGDIFAPRLAGNYATADILGGMEFATKLMGARVIVVVGHTECGAVKGACDDVQLGNLTTVMQAIRPAVVEVTDIPGERNSHNKGFLHAVTEENVRLTVAKIRTDSPILRELEGSGQIKIVGAMYDIAAGRVTYLN